MTNPREFPLTGYEKQALPYLGRVYKIVPGTGKVAVVQTDITGITRTVRRFNTNAGAWGTVSTTENGTALNISNVIFNTLQTDNGWWKDAIGYNFADSIPASSFPGLGKYIAVYELTPSSNSFAIFPLVLKPIEIVSLQGTQTEG